MIEKLKKIDIFHSPSYDVSEPTNKGGVLSIIALVFCIGCICSEFSAFRRGYTKEMVFVEEIHGGNSKIAVNMDITIHDLSCDHVSLDIQDGHGRFEIDEGHKVEPNKEYDLTKEDVRNSCRFHGTIYVRHMKGNFHFTPRGEHHHANTSLSHSINALTFGDTITEELAYESYLNHDTLKYESKTAYEGETHDYNVKLIKTELYVPDEDYHAFPYQYTYTHRHFVGHHKGKPLPPRVFFRLDFSPLTMRFITHYDPFIVFVSRHLALVGGTFAILKLFYDGFHVVKEAKFL